MKHAACLVLLAWLSGFLAAEAQQPITWTWTHQESASPPRVEINLRAHRPLAQATVTAKAGEQELPVKFTPLAEMEGTTGAVLFLIDKSDPKRVRAIEAAKALTLRLVGLCDARTRPAVYAFDSALVPVAGWETPRAEFAARLKGVRATGMATELYRDTLEALGLLQRVPATRRALVLFSDGRAEDTTYTLEQTISEAVKVAIPIFCVGYAENAQGVVYLQSLRRLSTGTGGLFAEASLATRRVPDRWVDDLFPTLFSGGVATVDLQPMTAGREIALEVKATGFDTTPITVPLDHERGTPPPNPADAKVDEVAGTVHQVEEKMAQIAQQVAAVPAQVEEAAKKQEAAREAAEKQAADEERQRQAAAESAAEAQRQEEAALVAESDRRQRLMWVCGLSLAALLVAGAVLFVWLRRAAAIRNQPIFARLQLLDGDHTEHLMRTTAIRVGRGKDNDLPLSNNSVSRHHAEISRTRDGIFTITELNSGNGVLVNGQSVEKAILKNEDLIELGEVRIRFLIT